MKRDGIIETFAVGPDGSSISCRRCGFTSHNKNDVLQHYCGRCHQFHDAIPPAGRQGWIDLGPPPGVAGFACPLCAGTGKVSGVDCEPCAGTGRI